MTEQAAKTTSQKQPLQLTKARSPRLGVTRWIMRRLGDLLFFKTTWKMKVNHLELVPRSGPSILIFNHVNIFDPLAAGSPITFRDPVPIGKLELMRNPIFALLVWGWAAILIRRGEVDRIALKKAIEVINSPDMLMITPEGHRNKDGLRNPREGVVLLAAQTGAVLVPAGVSGADKFLHNLWRLRRTEITVNYGRPFRFKGNIARKQYMDASHEVMFQLAALIEPHLRGEYADLSKATMNYIEYV